MLMIYINLLESDDDKAKLEEIYLKYEHFMFQVAVGIMRNTPDAEDVMHDSLMKIVRNIDNIVEVDHPKTKHYISVIVKNTCKDLLRRKKFNVDFDSVNDDDISSVSAEETVIERSTIEEIRRCLEGLDDMAKDILIFRYVHEMSYEVIANTFGISTSAARKRVQRGKAELAKRLTEQETETTTN